MAAGPWIQAPNYTRSGGFTDNTRINNAVTLGLDYFPAAYAYQSIQVDGGPAMFQDGSFLELIGAIKDNGYDMEQNEWPLHPRVTELHRNSSQINFTPPGVWLTEGAIGYGHCPFPIIHYAVDGTFFPGEAPAGAAGIEWQDHPEWTSYGLAERVGMKLKAGTLLRETGYNVPTGRSYTFGIGLADISRAQAGTYFGPPDPGDPNPGQVTQLWSENRPLSVTEGGYSEWALEDDIDLTTAVDLEQGGVLFTVNEGFIPSIEEGYLSTWGYGSAFHQLTLEYTWKPPVYRWLFNVITGEQEGTRRRFARPR